MKRDEMIKKASEVLNMKLVECKEEGYLRDTLYQDEEISIEEIKHIDTNEAVTIAYYVTAENGEIQAMLKIDE